MMMKPNVLLITILVLIIVLFKYVFYILVFTIKYLIVFGLPYKYQLLQIYVHCSVFKI